LVRWEKGDMVNRGEEEKLDEEGFEGSGIEGFFR
jgi:hypothetical protein